MTTTKEITNRAAALLAGHNNDTLIDMMNMTYVLRAGLERGTDEWRAANQTFIWITEELESRFDVDAAMNAWADSDTGLTYAQALTEAIAAVRKS